jgi:hypothetical protein
MHDGPMLYLPVSLSVPSLRVPSSIGLYTGKGRRKPTVIRPKGRFEIALNLLGNTKHNFTALVGQLSHLIE